MWDDSFTAMPPLEAKASVGIPCRGARKETNTRSGRSETRVHRRGERAKCDEEEWVELPDEFEKFGKYARLKRCSNGMRKTASRWEDDCAGRLVNDGCQRGRATSTMFYHPQTHVRVVVHGDDFAFAATESELRKVRSRMCERYDVKVRGVLRRGKRDVREIEILARNLRWTDEGLEYEASDTHRQALLEGEIQR